MFTKWTRLLGATLLLLTGGCASVSITSLQENPAQAPTKGTKGGAVVEAFEGRISPEGTMFYNQTNGLIYGERTQGGGEVGAVVAKSIQQRLKKSWDGGRLRVRGQVLEEEAGSYPLRAAIGLGVGGSRLAVRTLVFNESASGTEPWLVIWTDGTSGREPGAIFSFVPLPGAAFSLPMALGGAGAGVVGAHTKGSSYDAQRTAKTVVDAILWAHAGRPPGRIPKFRGVIREAAVGFTAEGRKQLYPQTQMISED